MTKFHRILICASVLGVLSPSSFAADVSMSDKRFLKHAAEAGIYEVEGSKLALKKIQG